MKTIINTHLDPKYNLALEEYVLKYVDTKEDILLLWQNRPSVIVGRNQNVFEEINHDYVHKNGIEVIRRISGGGTVYHDLGNINFSLITGHIKERLSRYDLCLLPIIEALNQMGVPAYLSGKSDIKVHDYKISGNAQSFHKNRMVHHGTLLFDANLEELSNVLLPTKSNITSKSIKSNRSQVANIKEYLPSNLSIDDFQNQLRSILLKSDDFLQHVIQLPKDSSIMIQKLIDEKYSQWSWNYGESPDFSITKSISHQEKDLLIYLEIQGGIINSCTHYESNIEFINRLCQVLTETRYQKESIQQKLEFTLKSILTPEQIHQLVLQIIN
jgi:lipoate-protein ligase A